MNEQDQAWADGAARYTRWTENTPDSVAVEAGEVLLNYQELGEAAAAVRNVVTGNTPERTAVAVIGRPSPGLVVAALGVWAARRVLVFLDPSHPVERIRAMTDAVDPALTLLVGDGTASLGPVTHTVCTVSQTGLVHDVVRGPHEGAPLPPGAAYASFTSGSSGTPKAVLSGHVGVRHFLDWERSELGVGPGDRVPLLTPVTFDVVMRDLLLPLSSGATLVVPTADELVAESTPLTWMRQARLTITHLVPSVTRDWLRRSVSQPRLPNLRAALFSGEPLHESLVKEFRNAASGADLFNLYGQTETTLAKTYHLVSDVAPGVQPVGRPLPGVKVRVLTAAGADAAPGEAGEVIVETPYRNIGYMGAADTPASGAFDPSLRSYRSGDLGRLNDNGLLEIVGRVDDQLKINGVRITPLEVESALTAHPRVSQAVVAATRDHREEQRLAAFVVPRGHLTRGALRTWLSDVLPADRIPSVLTFLPHLPLTQHGKVDRSALPWEESEGPVPTDPADPGPRTTAERLVHRIWRDVLDSDRISREDDFFSLGGHSLLALHTAARIRAETGAELTLRDFFEAPNYPSLARRLDGESGESLPRPTPLARKPGDLLPLSSAQRQMWWSQQLASAGSTAFTLVRTRRRRGRIDASHLADAIAAVVNRHDALRTTFHVSSLDGVPVRRVHPDMQVLPQIVAVDTPAALQRFLKEEASAPFDLGSGPPFRAFLVETGTQESVLVLAAHHIVADEWSMDLVAEEVAAHYEAIAEGEAPPAQALGLRYCDYVEWEQALSADRTQRDLATACATRLEGASIGLALPLDRPRTAVPGFQGGTTTFTLDSDTVRSLRAVASAENASLFMVYLAALQAALARYSASSDIVVGTPVANRPLTEWEPLVGLFVNTVPVRTRLPDDPTATEVLRRARDAALRAFDHQGVPFEAVLEALGHSGGLGHTPLVQVMLHVRERDRGRPTRAADGTKRWYDHHTPEKDTTRFDLQLTAEERSDGGMDCRLLFATALFDEETVRTLGQNILTVLKAFVDAPETPVALLDFGDVFAVHGGYADFPEQTVLERVRCQATVTPDAPAVRGGGQVLTYGELDIRTNQLAHNLRSAGIGPGTIVGVALERGIDLVVALLGVLKAGGAYLPLDTRNPVDRLRYVLDDARVSTVLTDSGHMTLFDGLGPVTVRVDDVPADLPGTPPDGEVSGHDLAYVIYTSGSTGRPKGVMVEHHSLANYVLWAAGAYPSTAGTALLHSPMSFDLTVTALYGPLVGGGCVEIGDLPTPMASGSVQEALPCTFLKATPSSLPVLVLAKAPGTPSGELVLGGEPLLGEQVSVWRADHPGVTVVNEYGPTETTVGCSQYRLGPTDPVPSGVLPIGFPIDNCSMYVLDSALRPVPQGAVGELFIGGDVVGRGYLGRPDLTAAAFLPDPYTDRPGARMYRSGDLARFRADGGLEFRGRRDRQVKIRGHRVELGEIESALLACDGVNEAAVTVSADGSTAVGHVVTESAIDTGELARQLRGRLPEYMVPDRVDRVPEIPRTANGKIDTDALASAEGPARAPGAGLRDRTEVLVANIWAEVMNIAPPGRDDDFFELGGNSLFAARIIGRLRQETGAEVPLRALFEHPTVTQLAATLSETDMSDDKLLPPLTRVVRGTGATTPGRGLR